MAIEEKEWLNIQTPASDIGREPEGPELHGERCMEKAVDVKTDRGETTDNDEMWDDFSDLDDDIIPGCYMLDIDLKGFPYPKIWIRADYIRVFNYLQVVYDRPRLHDIAPAVVITGQPGIGECLIAH